MRVPTPEPVRLGLALALTAVLVAVGAGPASAHASLLSTDPADGTTVEAVPEQVTLTFNENIGNPAYVAITAPDGEQLELADVKAVDHTVTATVEPSGLRGVHEMSYRVVSADGHPVKGTVVFTTTTGDTVDPVATSADASQESFLHRHREHVWWAGAAVVVALVLLLVPLRRRSTR
ncbi:copper resistance protein CopC [Aeromicrobium sp. IC_218]|uniref:copper resistance CopC family protein n=1 Tax=Aeromicrobium sp. IC_218 TaxID=2545468 RepID=UPI0013F3E8E7|nr:copper resistance protein CopC [Aeromicrobium sp. IC_218]